MGWVISPTSSLSLQEFAAQEYPEAKVMSVLNSSHHSFWLLCDLL